MFRSDLTSESLSRRLQIVWSKHVFWMKQDWKRASDLNREIKYFFKSIIDGKQGSKLQILNFMKLKKKLHHILDKFNYDAITNPKNVVRATSLEGQLHHT